MHKFAFFFMLAFAASLTFVLSEQVFAQEATESASDQASSNDSMGDATGDSMADTTDGSMTDTADSGTSSGQATTDSSSMETMTASSVASPLKQLSMGVDPHQIQCAVGHKLVFKASNWHPACVKESSFETLSSRGWVANHDPSHEDLTKMMEEHMAKYPAEPSQGSETHMEENMNVDGTSATNSTGTDAPKPKSHTIDLSESMEMGAQ